MRRKLGRETNVNTQQEPQPHTSIKDQSSDGDQKLLKSRPCLSFKFQMHQPRNEHSDTIELMTSNSESSHYRTQLKREDVSWVLNRHKLKMWLLEVTAGYGYQRETYALASKLIDMYHARQEIQKKHLQTLSLACLVIAAKANQRVIPNISYQVFNRKLIFEFQHAVFKSLDYRIFPTTYVSMMEYLLCCWDAYPFHTAYSSGVKYLLVTHECIGRYRAVMEKLDCLDLVPETHNIGTASLVLNVFAVENQRFCLESYSKIKSISQKQARQQQLFKNNYNQHTLDFFRYLGQTTVMFAQGELLPHIQELIMGFEQATLPAISEPGHRLPRIKTRQTCNVQLCQVVLGYIQKQPKVR